MEVRNMMRDMDRRMEKFERDFFRSPLSVITPRFIPVDRQGMAKDLYRVNIDVQGFKPEDIKISLKDNVMKIEAQMDRTAEDGSRIQQSIIREFTVPENVDISTVKSLLHDGGILSIEAGLDNGKQPQPQAIPIEKGDSKPKSKI